MRYNDCLCKAEAGSRIPNLDCPINHARVGDYPGDPNVRRYAQSRDVRMREVSLAVIDAGLLGAGLLQISPLNDLTWVPLEAVTIDIDVLNRLREEKCSP